jgi:hypothetical protein
MLTNFCDKYIDMHKHICKEIRIHMRVYCRSVTNVNMWLLTTADKLLAYIITFLGLGRGLALRRGLGRGLGLRTCLRRGRGLMCRSCHFKNGLTVS